MSDVPSVSIAMATYNGAAFLPAQLRSLATQSVKPTELVIGDDRSSDATVAVIEQFARTAPFPVRLAVNDQQLGYKRNFMAVAHRCTGDTIAFCDQDDVWYPDKIAVVTRSMADPAVVLSFHDYDLIDADDEIGLRHYSQGALLDHGSTGSALGLTQTFRRALLDLSPAFDVSRDENHPDQVMAHDQWIHFLGRGTGIVRHLPQALLGYRQHGGNVCGQPHRDARTERRLSNNPAVLASYLRGDTQAFQQKRRLLRADLDWQRFSLAHRIDLLEHLASMLDERAQAEALRSTYRSRLRFVDDRLSLYQRIHWMDRLSAFVGMVCADLSDGLLRDRLKKRLLDLTYGTASPN